MLPIAFISFCQIITALVLRVTLNLVARQKVHFLSPGFQKNQRYLIVSNHQTIFDGGLLAGALPLSALFKLMPLGFMTKNAYINRWWKKVFLYPLGMYPALREGEKKAGLDLSRELIAKNFTLIIFPEGQRAFKGEQRPRKGAAVLAHQEKLIVQPVAIDWARGKRARVIFGPQYCLAGTTDYEMWAHFMVNNIYGLMRPRD
jgi:1-acyl-sn-glycerol-3-phosphate acyltransferase